VLRDIPKPPWSCPSVRSKRGPVHQLRLVSQLCSPNYENTPEEAQEIVQILDQDVRRIAEVFGVEYATRIGKSGTKSTHGAQSIGTVFQRVNILDEIAVVQVLENLRAGRLEEVENTLRGVITGKRVA